MISNHFKLKIGLWYQLLSPATTFCSFRLSSNDVTKSRKSEYRAKCFRQEKTYKGIVQNIFNASPSIKVIRIYLKETEFSFQAGQWVDFQVPGISEVKGYSITSPPYKAKENGIIDLAVKNGKSTLTQWIHTSCCEGEEVQVTVGGDFYHDAKAGTLEAEADLLLVGGGVGVNPMVSIICEYSHLQSKEAMGKRPGKVHLLYSAKTAEELVFKDIFSQIETELPAVTCQYFITGAEEKTKISGIKYSRIKEADVKQSIEQLQTNKTLCYICGPSTMTDDVASWLQKLGVNQKFIRYEKWW